MVHSAYTNIPAKDVPFDETLRGEGERVAPDNWEIRHFFCFMRSRILRVDDDRAVKKIMTYFICVLFVMVVIPVVFIGHGIIKELQEHVNMPATNSTVATRPFEDGQESIPIKGPLNTPLPFTNGGENILPYTESTKDDFPNFERSAKVGSDNKTSRTWGSTIARGSVTVYYVAATIANVVYVILCGPTIAALVNIPVHVTAEPKRSAVLVASGLLLVVNWAKYTLGFYKDAGGFD